MIIMVLAERNLLRHPSKRSGAAYRCGHNLLKNGDVR